MQPFAATGHASDLLGLSCQLTCHTPVLLVLSSIRALLELFSRSIKSLTVPSLRRHPLPPVSHRGGLPLSEPAHCGLPLAFRRSLLSRSNSVRTLNEILQLSCQTVSQV